MTIWYRSIISLIRQPLKTLLLFLLVASLGSVMAGAYVINAASTVVMDDLRTKLAAQVSVKGSFVDLEYSNSYGQSYQHHLDDMTRMAVLCDGLRSDPDVRYAAYNYFKFFNFGSLASPDDAMVQLDDGSDMMIDFGSWIAADVVTNALAKGKMDVMTRRYLLIKQMLWGDSDANLTDLRRGLIGLYAGRTFTEQEIRDGASVAVVPYNYEIYDSSGSRRRVKTGDAVTFNYLAVSGDEVVGSQTYTFMVVGTYYEMHDAINPSEGYFDSYGERVHVPNKTLLDIQDSQQLLNQTSGGQAFSALWRADTAKHDYGCADIYMHIPYIEVASMDSLSAVVASIKRETSGIAGIKVPTSASTFDRVAGPIGGMEGLSHFIMLVMPALALAIMSLTIVAIMKDRRHEIGIYMSLGEPNGHIAGQMLAEALIIGTMALVFALGLGTRAASGLAGRVIAGYHLTADPAVNGEVATITTSDVIASFHIQVNAADVAAIAGLVYGVIIAAVGLSLLYTLRISPRKVLMQQE